MLKALLSQTVFWFSASSGLKNCHKRLLARPTNEVETMDAGICAILGVVGNLYPKQNYSSVARSFDRWIPSAENVLATSIVEDLVNCSILIEHSYIGNLKTQLSQTKAMGHSFTMARFIRIKRCIKILYHLSEVILVPGHFVGTR